ncbi:kinesin light chain 3-like isoform X2 [Senna tora]|uniref:Kinesin light chain 3-like isoform X2 n=1 Tax=Senna tora TaxID=362788 RepID=A0A834TZ84_9FABA|nr:kinesin light chain 3-like isoform X2 [Senna tora]
MSLRLVAANLIKRFRFPARDARSASVRNSKASPISLSGEVYTSHWHGSGAYGWRIDPRDPRLWIVIYGHIALILGINANPVFAKDASSEAVSDNDTEQDDGKIVEAEKLFLSAVQEAKEGFGQRDPHVASACNNLAELYRIKKAFDKAEPLYLEAINILEESFGPEDIRVGAAAHNLGMFYLGQRKLEEAHVYYAVLYLQGKERDAEAFIQDSIRMLEEAGEGESFICIRRLRYLSQIYVRSHRLAEAEIVQRKILHIMELSKGWKSLDTVNAAESLALTLQAFNNLKDSQELLERCLDARKAVLPGDHIQIAANLLHLARGIVLNSSQLQVCDASREAGFDKAKDHLNDSTSTTWFMNLVTLNLIPTSAANSGSEYEGKFDYIKININDKDFPIFIHILPYNYGDLEDLSSSCQTHQGVLLAEGQILWKLGTGCINGSSGRSAFLKMGSLSELAEPGGHINLEAREALRQCVLAYRKYGSEKSIADTPEIKKEYLSCIKCAQNVLGGKFAEETTNEKDFRS